MVPCCLRQLYAVTMPPPHDDRATASPNRIAPSNHIDAAPGVTIAWHVEPTLRADSRGASTSFALRKPPGRRRTSRRLLRELLEERIGGEHVVSQRCPECGSETHGPLTVVRSGARADGVRRAPLASVSYAGPLTVVGIADVRRSRGALGISAFDTGASDTDAFGIDAELDTPATRRAAAEALVASGVIGSHAPTAGSHSAAADLHSAAAGSRSVTADSHGAAVDPVAALREWTRIEAMAKARRTGLRTASSTEGSEESGALTCIDLLLPAAQGLETPAILTVALGRGTI